MGKIKSWEYQFEKRNLYMRNPHKADLAVNLSNEMLQFRQKWLDKQNKLEEMLIPEVNL